MMSMRNLLKWLCLMIAVVIGGPAVLKNVDLNDLFSQDTVQRTAPSSPQTPTSRRTSGNAGIVMVAMPPCTNGRHAPPSGSCVIDGDSGWLNGKQWRLEGIDTPEIGKPECAAERQTGELAKKRMVDLLSDGFAVTRGKDDRYGRELLAFKLANGRDVGDVLIRERLAQPWPNRGNVWCD
jgi:endonuclease YncB( thermonuclease family)